MIKKKIINLGVCYYFLISESRNSFGTCQCKISYGCEEELKSVIKKVVNNIFTVLNDRLPNLHFLPATALPVKLGQFTEFFRKLTQTSLIHLEFIIKILCT